MMYCFKSTVGLASVVLEWYIIAIAQCLCIFGLYGAIQMLLLLLLLSS